MKVSTGITAPWTGAAVWPQVRWSPFVVVLAGIDSSEIVDVALTDSALTDIAMPRLEPACTPPCDALLWRLETSSGQGLNQPGLLQHYWHRAPYAITIRLIQYQPGSLVPEILDEGTLGTRGPYSAFSASVARLAMRFVRDAALGRGRGPAVSAPAANPGGLPGWLDASLSRWRDRLMTEWWGLGVVSSPVDHVLSGSGLGDVTWYRTEVDGAYLADPFPWPGSGRILCEEMPLTGGVGRIVSVTESDGRLLPGDVLLDDGYHHSYPSTFQEGEVTFCVPESTERGATCIFRLTDNGRLLPASEVAPHARLADPTLFRWNGLYWLACTDLDLGSHDNLCLLHASEITGPWMPHARWPVKIDVRGARPAGMILHRGGRLFRPAQDCASTYGAAVAIHEILELSETEFRETPVAELRPDGNGPFPHGLHTLVHDGERFWIDGKRYVFDLGLMRQKLSGRIRRFFS